MFKLGCDSTSIAVVLTAVRTLIYNDVYIIHLDFDVQALNCCDSDSKSKDWTP